MTVYGRRFFYMSQDSTYNLGSGVAAFMSSVINPPERGETLAS